MSELSTNISVYKTGTKKWMAQITIGKDNNGKRKFKRFSADKKIDAINKAKEYLKSVYGIASTKDVLYTDEYLMYFLNNVKKPKLRNTSFDREKRTFVNHIIPFIGHYPLVELNPAVIKGELFDVLYKKGYSYSSIHKAYISLNSALEHAIDEDKLIKNPCSKIDPPPKKNFENSEIRFLNEDEIASLKEQAYKKYKTGNPRYIYGRQILFVMYTGLRAGEMCALKWSDIDLKKKVMKINKIASTAYNTGSRKTEICNRTKTENGIRIVPLNQQAITLLEELKQIYNPQNSDYVVTCNKEYISPDVLSNSYSDMCARASFANLLFYF